MSDQDEAAQARLQHLWDAAGCNNQPLNPPSGPTPPGGAGYERKEDFSNNRCKLPSWMKPFPLDGLIIMPPSPFPMPSPIQVGAGAGMIGLLEWLEGLGWVIAL